MPDRRSGRDPDMRIAAGFQVPADTAGDNWAAVRMWGALDLPGPDLYRSDHRAGGRSRRPDSSWNPDWGCIVRLRYRVKRVSSWEWGRVAGQCRAKRLEPGQQSRVP